MSDESPAPETPASEIVEKPRRNVWLRWSWRLTKIAGVLIALFLIGLTVLSNMGGSSDVLKKSVEDFISESTPYKAEIGKFNGMTFFPDVAFDFEGVEFYHPDFPSPVIYLGKMRVAFGFWDVMSRNGKIKVFDVGGLKALSGTLLQKPLVIDSLKIIDSKDGPRLEASGSVDNRPLYFSSNMQAKGKGPRKKYSFGSDRHVDLTLADIKFTADIISADDGTLICENIAIKAGEKPVTEGGRLEISRGYNKINVTGNFDIGDKHTDIEPALEIYRSNSKSPREITGELKSKNFHLEDFAPGSAYDSVLNTLEQLFGEISLPGNTAVKLNAENISGPGANTGSYNDILPLKGLRIDTQALAGKTP